MWRAKRQHNAQFQNATQLIDPRVQSVFALQQNSDPSLRATKRVRKRAFAIEGAKMTNSIIRKLIMSGAAAFVLYSGDAGAAPTAEAGDLAAKVQALQMQLDALKAKVGTKSDAATDAPPVGTALSSPKPGTISFGHVSLSTGGMFEAATIFRSHAETADIGSSYAKIPFANDRGGHTSETRFSPRQSRLFALIQADVAPGLKVSGYGEWDFQAAAQTANAVESSGYSPRVRAFYGTVDWESEGLSLLAGQNWSLATLNNKGISLRGEAPPPGIDAQYVPGFVWARQPQIRLTKTFTDGFVAAVSLENAQTTFGNLSIPTGVTLTNVQAPVSGFYSGNNYSLNAIPDVIVKGAWDGPLAGHQTHVEGFGLYRSFYDRVAVSPSAGNQAGALGLMAAIGNHLSSGWGIGGSVVTQLLPGLLDLQGSFLFGEGVGRYGSGQLADVSARPDGTLVALPETMFMAGATMHLTPTFDLYIFGGGEQEEARTYTPVALSGVAFGNGTLPGSDNSGCLVEGGTCNAVNRGIAQITTGFWKKLYQGAWGRVQVGAQYSYTERHVFVDRIGLAPTANENMVFTSLRFYPF